MRIPPNAPPNTPPVLKETPSQTAGPYVHIGLRPSVAGFAGYTWEPDHQIANPADKSRRIRISGTVFDGTGAPVKDALIEAWQADANGHYPHPEDGRPVMPGFRGFGRAAADLESGEWHFDTIRPGPVPGPGGTLQAPHVSLWIVARGINIGLHTRLYFPEDAALHATDPLLAIIPDPRRRETLIATREKDGEGVTYRFDIHIQGEYETVFLDI